MMFHFQSYCPSTSTQCRRIGIHNDCFMAGSDDIDTFRPGERDWLYQEALDVMVGGETCSEQFDSSSVTCDKAIEQIKKQRFTYLNLEWYQPVIAIL